MKAALQAIFCKLLAQIYSIVSSVKTYNQVNVHLSQVILLSKVIFWLHVHVKSYALSGLSGVIGLDIYKIFHIP
jgi:hypothetical protein